MQKTADVTMMNLSIPSTTPTSSTTYEVPPPPSARTVSPIFHWDHISSMQNPNNDPTHIHHKDIHGLGLANYLIREPNQGWWKMVEHQEDATAVIGDRFLVRQDRDTSRGTVIIRDYISTRIDTPAKWSRQSVVYYKGAASPYEYHHDRYRNRFDHLPEDSLIRQAFLQSLNESQ